jgi:hypothetical protein
MNLLDQVAAQLEASGLSVTRLADAQAPTTDTTSLLVPFEGEGKRQDCYVVQSRGDEYFFIFAPTIASRRLDDVDADVLRKMIRAESSHRLAKLEYVEAGPAGFYFATSACSTENFTAGKLRRRMEAAANLAGEIAKILANVGVVLR